jgi:DNA-binding winged helix-turn-helix (wHTH) protein
MDQTSESTIAYEFGPFWLSATKHLLKKHDERVRISQKEIQVLRLLVERAGHIVTRDEFNEKVWKGRFVERNNLDQHIGSLREVLAGSRADREYIETFSGEGYQFVADVKVIRKSAVGTSTFRATGPSAQEGFPNLVDDVQQHGTSTQKQSEVPSDEELREFREQIKYNIHHFDELQAVFRRYLAGHLTGRGAQASAFKLSCDMNANMLRGMGTLVGRGLMSMEQLETITTALESDSTLTSLPAFVKSRRDAVPYLERWKNLWLSWSRKSDDELRELWRMSYEDMKQIVDRVKSRSGKPSESRTPVESRSDAQKPEPAQEKSADEEPDGNPRIRNDDMAALHNAGRGRGKGNP